MTDFAELGVSAERAGMLRAQGIVKPTPVQEETIPLVYAGRDVISQAQTGTGKTLAFVLPMLDKIKPEQLQVQGLIVTPTRELAIQITAEIKKLLDPQGAIKVLAVYGGQDVEAQLHKLKGDIQLIVATPGRLLDHLRRETVTLEGVKMLVLDEADQMLHMGFLKEVEEVLRQTPYKKQTMLFSATMPPKIRELAGQILRNPEHITVKTERVTVKGIRQWVVETTDRNKQATLVQLIEETKPYLSMIFCRTKRRASTLNAALQEMGYESDELHGDLTQAKREQVMKRFRDAKLQLLVATDVAARGLDVEGVTHVFNYDVPLDVESYIHRIGRTGRAGESGLAITLIAPKDRRELADIENGIAMAMERRSVDGAPLGGGGLQAPRASGGTSRASGEIRRPRSGAGVGRSAGAGVRASAGRGAAARSGGSGVGRGGRSAGAGAAAGRAGRGESAAAGASAGRGGRSAGAGAAAGRAGRGESAEAGASTGRGGRSAGAGAAAGRAGRGESAEASASAGRGGRSAGAGAAASRAGRGESAAAGASAGRGGRSAGAGAAAGRAGAGNRSRAGEWVDRGQSRDQIKAGRGGRGAPAERAARSASDEAIGLSFGRGGGSAAGAREARGGRPPASGGKSGAARSGGAAARFGAGASGSGAGRGGRLAGSAPKGAGGGRGAPKRGPSGGGAGGRRGGGGSSRGR